MADTTRRLAFFGGGSRDKVPSEAFGNKAANLAQMATMKISVPPGFALGVSICEDFHRAGDQLPPDVPKLLEKGLQFVENATGLRYGDRRRPLLVSVRSGAPVSMPGLMETLLNVGLNRQTLDGLIFMSGNPCLAWDSYRRLIQSMGQTVFLHEVGPYDSLLRHALESEGVPDAIELDSGSLRRLATEFEGLFADLTGRRFPTDVREQLRLATSAVLGSARGARVEAFLKAQMLESAPLTAVTVQTMVFGNRGMNSGAGVAFTRDPSTGANEMMVDFKFGVQGDDVVSGEATGSASDFKQAMPEMFRELKRVCRRLEQDCKDMQDIEFTVQEGELFILQSRAGKRAPLAALRIAVEMVAEGLITPAAGLVQLGGIDPETVVMRRVVSDEEPLGFGEPASAGVASGRMALTSERAEAYSSEGPAILVQNTLSPDDLPGVTVAAGLLAARGARTSHAAVIARQLGKVCVVNCSDLVLGPAEGRCRFGEREVVEGDVITLDGNLGAVYAGKLDVVEEKPSELIEIVRGWRTV